METYSTQIKTVDMLTASEQDAMATLYLNYYDASHVRQVKADLAEKSEALLLFHQGELVGFTTLLVYERLWHNEPVLIVYSGDTIVDRAHWGQQALAIAWINRMGTLAASHAGKPMYWFLIVKGHRTFKYLPTFANSFYPHWSEDRSDLEPLARLLAKERFGDDYNEASGVVEYRESKGQLKDEIAHPTDEELNREAIRFFMERNPGYLQGHELVCLCEISEENMKPLTRRVFRRGRNG